MHSHHDCCCYDYFESFFPTALLVVVFGWEGKTKLMQLKIKCQLKATNNGRNVVDLTVRGFGILDNGFWGYISLCEWLCALFALTFLMGIIESLQKWKRTDSIHKHTLTHPRIAHLRRKKICCLMFDVHFFTFFTMWDIVIAHFKQRTFNNEHKMC